MYLWGLIIIIIKKPSLVLTARSPCWIWSQPVWLGVLPPEFCCVDQGSKKGRGLGVPKGSLCARLSVSYFTAPIAKNPTGCPMSGCTSQGLGFRAMAWGLTVLPGPALRPACDHGFDGFCPLYGGEFEGKTRLQSLWFKTQRGLGTCIFKRCPEVIFGTVRVREYWFYLFPQPTTEDFHWSLYFFKIGVLTESILRASLCSWQLPAAFSSAQCQVQGMWNKSISRS